MDEIERRGERIKDVLCFACHVIPLLVFFSPLLDPFELLLYFCIDELQLTRPAEDILPFPLSCSCHSCQIEAFFGQLGKGYLVVNGEHKLSDIYNGVGRKVEQTWEAKQSTAHCTTHRLQSFSHFLC